MPKGDQVKKSLDYILKNGDIYDAISRKNGKGAIPKALLRANILAFSRILFLGTMVGGKIRRFLFSVDKVKECQDIVRDYLGVKVDIVRGKVKNAFFPTGITGGITVEETIYSSWHIIWDEPKVLSIFYEDRFVSSITYMDNLRKIMDFCSEYGIDQVFLSEDDILRLYPDAKIDGFDLNLMSNVFIYSEEKYTDKFLLILSLEELYALVEYLDSLTNDKDIILKLGEEIEDVVITRALERFAIDGNHRALKNVVESRLTLHINDESAYKDKKLGHCFDVVQISKEFIKVTQISNDSLSCPPVIMTLYDFLGVHNYKELINKTNLGDDDSEIYAISKLYLFLVNNKCNMWVEEKEAKYSLYDKLYNAYKQKEEVFETGTGMAKFYSYLMSLAFSISLFALILSGCSMATFIARYIFHKPYVDYTKSTIETVAGAYQDSFNYEMALLYDFAEVMNGFLDNTDIIFSNKTGDASVGLSKGNGKGPVAYVTTYDENIAPEYYAMSYGASSDYKFGGTEYDLQTVPVDFSSFCYNDTVCAVRTSISARKLKDMIVNNYLHLEQMFYPVGDNYSLTYIIIKDGERSLTFDYTRAIINGGFITNEEVELLKSFKNPQIIYYYGIDYTKQNGFVSGLTKDNENNEDLRKIIVSSLGLPENASNMEVFMAINRKFYSETPIKDAGLGLKVKFMDEENYYKTIASLDSLVCNMAADLTCKVDNELIFVVGFYDTNNDNVITLQEAHAWNMSESGRFVDTTPYLQKEEKEDDIGQFIENALEFFADNGLPLLVCFACVSLLVSLFYGKKISFIVHNSILNKMLKKEGISEGFSTINSYLYGGVNLPMEYTQEQIIDKMAKDYMPYSNKELKVIKRRIAQSPITKDARTKALAILKNVPFVRENTSDIKRILRKRK